MVVWVLFKKSLVFDQTFFCSFDLDKQVFPRWQTDMEALDLGEAEDQRQMKSQ
jgi:hypothetical protein